MPERSSGRRGGLRSHKGPGGRTYDQLYNEAKEKGVKGRSKMSKNELTRAVRAIIEGTTYVDEQESKPPEVDVPAGG